MQALSQLSYTPTKGRNYSDYFGLQGPSRRPAVRLVISIFWPCTSAVTRDSPSMLLDAKRTRPSPEIPCAGQETVSCRHPRCGRPA